MYADKHKTSHIELSYSCLFQAVEHRESQLNNLARDE